MAQRKSNVEKYWFTSVFLFQIQMQKHCIISVPSLPSFEWFFGLNYFIFYLHLYILMRRIVSSFANIVLFLHYFFFFSFLVPVWFSFWSNCVFSNNDLKLMIFYNAFETRIILFNPVGHMKYCSFSRILCCDHIFIYLKWTFICIHTQTSNYDYRFNPRTRNKQYLNYFYIKIGFCHF